MKFRFCLRLPTSAYERTSKVKAARCSHAVVSHASRQGDRFAECRHRLRKPTLGLQRIAEQHGVAPDAVALAWLLAHPARIMPIVGTRHPQRLARLADAFKVSLDRETWFELWTLAAGQDVP